MKHFIFIFLLCSLFVLPANALELEAPPAPKSVEKYMPNYDNFTDGLIDIIHKALKRVRPDLSSALSVCIQTICTVIFLSVADCFPTASKTAAKYVSTIAISSILFFSTNSMIQLGTDIISEMSEYGKLLFPVLTTALAAQGGITSSAAIYTGATAFLALACALISKIFLPMIYLFLGVSTADCALGENLLNNTKLLIKQIISWSLKTLLTIFTAYLSITGTVSGTTDAAALKATKVTISSFVPVVGSILSDASEAVLVSVGIAKNAAGIYGIFAILSIFLSPFLKLGTHYLILKATSSICSFFGSKNICNLINDFSIAMGLILAMASTVCVFLLIATICFLKGAG